MRNLHYYTPEEKKWLRDHLEYRSFAELTGLFNKQFGVNVSRGSLQNACWRMGLSNKMKGKQEANRKNLFKKGCIPWNKGRKIHFAQNSGMFRKGQLPPSYRPVGSLYRKKCTDFLYIKVADPSVWRLYHHVVWEQAHGHPIPPNRDIIFADGNKNNFAIENLLLVSKADSVRLYTSGLNQPDADLTKAGLALVRLQRKIKELGAGK